MEFTINGLKQNEFVGFIRIKELWTQGYDSIPNQQGVYAILRDSIDPPEFLPVSVGGSFKGKDPTVAVAVLEQCWVAGPEVIYIGKAGGAGVKGKLNDRLMSYLRFGQGKKYSHWGGRYIWQLKGFENLLVAYRPLPNKEPRTVEKDLIREFIRIYGKKPFANIDS